MTDKVMTMMEQSPLPKMIAQFGMSLSDAQREMDKKSLEMMQWMASEDNGVKVGSDGETKTLLELGFTPSFYHFSEAWIEARISVSMTRSSEYTLGGSIGGQFKIFTATLNASYTNKYSFKSEGASTVSTKLVSVPPPEMLNQLIVAHPREMEVVVEEAEE